VYSALCLRCSFFLSPLQPFRGCADGVCAWFLLSNQQHCGGRLSRGEILCDSRATGGLSSWKIQQHNSPHKCIVMHSLCGWDEGQRSGENKPSRRMCHLSFWILLRRWVSDSLLSGFLLSLRQQREYSLRSREILHKRDAQCELSCWSLGQQSWSQCGESMCGVSLWHLPQRIDWSTDCLLRLHSLSRRSLE
jgi:hypothetical protein